MHHAALLLVVGCHSRSHGEEEEEVLRIIAISPPTQAKSYDSHDLKEKAPINCFKGLGNVQLKEDNRHFLDMSFFDKKIARKEVVLNTSFLD